MTLKLLSQYVLLILKGLEMLCSAMEWLSLYDCFQKVAHTIAYLEVSVSIQAYHVAEAVGYRSLDRKDRDER